MSLRTFKSAAEFRTWLARHHGCTQELLVRCYKSHAKDKGLTYRQALDEALCFGWIDGVRRSVDGDSFSTRFTPRRPKSKWSAVNIRRATELESEGKLAEAGRKAFAARHANRTTRYSFEEKPRKLDAAGGRLFRANRAAWEFFQAQAPWYRRTSIFWVTEAKREETRRRRLAELIACSARGEPIGPLKWRKS
jgi:uncharacterized protein YdeI (YjbR/CyaY-like superfamily)